MKENRLPEESTVEVPQTRKPWKPNPRLAVLLDISSTANGSFTFLGESDSFHS